MEPKGFLKTLNITDKQRWSIERTIMYSIFRSYVSTTDGNPVDTTEVAKSLFAQFRGKQRIAAAYLFGTIEHEYKTGESFDLLEDLRRYATALFQSQEITPVQFNTVCKELTKYYAKIGRIRRTKK